MYLKRLTLRGFKSFASATTLTFEPGITCVVGPNGSGKSNVVDALAWVMGEQGAKTLRGGQMADVIFAGTAKRAPLGRAEVELTIDNSDGALPIEYAEVTITRTMFRSGGSEYAINGTAARLLDVQELLSDSGIGREMHVIVGQGQLDAILQATPESRRGFIEEAAGVLKHRKRKEKALRKLEATKANLDRLTDLIAELARQLKPLGRQAETARKAATIQAELRDAKARLIADELVTAQAALTADLADEAAVERARSNAEASLAQTTRGEAQAEADLKAAAVAYDTTQEAWYALSGLRERVSSTRSIAAERARLGAAQPELSFGGRDPDALEHEAAEARLAEQELAERVSAAGEALTEATQARNDAEQRHAAAEATYAADLRAVADQREGLARLAGQVNSLESRLEASGEEVDRLTRRRDEAATRADEAARAYHAAESSLAGLGVEESDLDATYESASAELAEAQGRVDDLAAGESQLASRRAGLEARVEALRLATLRKDGTQALLEANRPGIIGRLADHLQIDAGWESAVAAALGPLAEALVVDGLDPAIASLHLLAAEDLGRVGLVVTRPGTGPTPRGSLAALVAVPPTLRGTVDALLGGFLAVESLEDAAAAAGSQPQTQLVTRGGDVISGWRVEGGSATAPSLLELTAELTAAEEEHNCAQHDLERHTFAVAQAAAELERARANEASVLEQLHASDAELAAVADTLSQLKQTQTGALREADRLREAITAAQETRHNDEQR
ncbi:MAG: chromosome segregation SMC family protein, partial [Arachnia sp.]